MSLTRNVTNIGTPENMFLSGSDQGAVTGCTTNSNPNINRGMKGGERVESAHDTSIPMGPKGGLVGHKTGTSCGVSNPLNLGASSQIGGNYASLEEGNASYGFDNVDMVHGSPKGAFSYPPISSKPQMSCQSGGRYKAKKEHESEKVCKDVSKVKSYDQVHAFWKHICPDSVTLNKELSKKVTKKNKKEYMSFIRNYTRAFCEEVYALRTKKTQTQKRRDHLTKYIKYMKKAASSIEKLDKKKYDKHITIFERHGMKIQNTLMVKKQKKSHKKKQNNNKKGGKHTMKQKKSSEKSRKKKHKKRGKHTMKGGKGYHQFNSNVPSSPGYGLNQGTMPKGGLLANPMPYHINNNCNDVYNHYTGVNSEAPMRG